MLLGEEVFARVYLQTSPQSFREGSVVGPPTSPRGDGQGITAKRPLSWGISCMERCAHTLGMLVHVPVNPFGKKPAGLCLAPARWPHGCSEVSRARVFWLSLCHGSRLERNSYG